jgi:hypothetical protein
MARAELPTVTSGGSSAESAIRRRGKHFSIVKKLARTAARDQLREPGGDFTCIVCGADLRFRPTLVHRT